MHVTTKTATEPSASLEYFGEHPAHINAFCDGVHVVSMGAAHSIILLKESDHPSANRFLTDRGMKFAVNLTRWNTLKAGQFKISHP